MMAVFMFSKASWRFSIRSLFGIFFPRRFPVLSRYYFDYDFDSVLGDLNSHMLNLHLFTNTEQLIAQETIL